MPIDGQCCIKAERNGYENAVWEQKTFWDAKVNLLVEILKDVNLDNIVLSRMIKEVDPAFVDLLLQKLKNVDTHITDSKKI